MDCSRTQLWISADDVRLATPRLGELQRARGRAAGEMTAAPELLRRLRLLCAAMEGAGFPQTAPRSRAAARRPGDDSAAAPAYQQPAVTLLLRLPAASAAVALAAPALAAPAATAPSPVRVVAAAAATADIANEGDAEAGGEGEANGWLDEPETDDEADDDTSGTATSTDHYDDDVDDMDADFDDFAYG